MRSDSLNDLQIVLARIDGLIRAAVARAQASGQDPTDALRGLIISTDEVTRHLQQDALHGLWQGNAQLPALDLLLESVERSPLSQLVAAFSLNAIDAYILLLAAAPELDRRYERLYAYLQDDVSQRYATVNLMMNMLGGTVEQRFAVYERLLPGKPLRSFHLVECSLDPSRPNSTFLAAHVKVDARVIGHLLGEALPDDRLKQTVRRLEGQGLSGLPNETVAMLRGVVPYCPIVFMQGRDGMGQHEAAALLCAEIGFPLLCVDLDALGRLSSATGLSFRLAVREGYLSGAALLFDGWKSILDEHEQPPAEYWSLLREYPYPVFICSPEHWEPLDRQRERRMVRVAVTVPPYQERRWAWERALQASGLAISEDALEGLGQKYRFTAAQIDRSVLTAADIAASRGEIATLSDLYTGAQAHASLNMGHLAKRINPRYAWDDLILPPDQLSQLKEISARARFGHIVQDAWGFGRKVSASGGVSALFAGESGTGKTLAAEVIAHDLGLVLYKIDLSAVVSKYIGETEKNLATIFDRAQSSNAILFFDEADALFGKRSEVKDARDRYANIEIAYLLQEIEAYDGIAILATNLRQNLDEAFTRRLHFLIDFPFPDSEYRYAIWAAHFPPEAPLGKDVDLADVAERYRLAGGNIRNAAVAAAYLAAADGGVITLRHIRSAIRREHQKMGRLLEESY